MRPRETERDEESGKHATKEGKAVKILRIQFQAHKSSVSDT